jgi:hypothetical protein
MSYPKPVAHCKTASGARQAITHIEYRILDARAMGWVALEQAWRRALNTALAEARQKGFTP